MSLAPYARAPFARATLFVRRGSGSVDAASRVPDGSTAAYGSTPGPPRPSRLSPSAAMHRQTTTVRLFGDRSCGGTHVAGTFVRGELAFGARAVPDEVFQVLEVGQRAELLRGRHEVVERRDRRCAAAARSGLRLPPQGRRPPRGRAARRSTRGAPGTARHRRCCGSAPCR